MHVRRTPRVVAALAAAVLGSTGLALGSSPSVAAADSTPGYSKTAILVDVKVGPANDQTCRISADLYKPDAATSTHKAPAILTTHGFGGNKADSNQLAIAKGFVNQGYVVLSYSGLGFGDTTCKISLDQPAYDGKAGKQLVDVLAGTRAYLPEAGGAAKKIGFVSQESKGDPRVGMIGGSYGGQIQYAVASQDPRIDAIIPIITWNDLSYSLAPNNTDSSSGVTYRTPGVAKKEWIDLFFGDGIISGAQGASVDPTRNVGCPNFVTQACTAVAELNAAGYPDDATLALARGASVSTYVHRIKTPTLLVQGQKDTLFNLQESLATFRALRAQGTPTRLIWQSWGHSSSTPAPGELDFGAASIRDSLLGRRFLSWMNHYVRGTAAAPVGPRFSYFRDWVRYDTSPAHAGTAVANAYMSQSSFSNDPTATFYFSGNDGLVKDPKNITSGAASYANAGPAPTSYSETSGVEGSQVNNPPSDEPGTFAAFTSKELATNTDLVGTPRLTVRLSAPLAASTQSGGPAGHLVLFAKIYDIAPDGTKTLHNRLISPVRVRDVTKPVEINLPAVVQRFKKGHRIQLVLAASDSAYGANAAPQPVTISISKAAPSTLRLPLLQALRLQ
jgi:predicted acyl esterase